MTLLQAQTISVRPISVAAPDRARPLEVRVTAPTSGDRLPVVVFSHGYGFSMDGYGPLVDHWAASGFVVVSPTHLDSVGYAIAPDDPVTPTIWRTRIADIGQVLDSLAEIASSVPELAGRLDPERVAVAGHSYGATTVSALLGATVLPPAAEPGENFVDLRVRAGVLLALAGSAGDAGSELTPLAREAFPFMSPDFAEMAPPALLVAGDADQSVLSTRGPDWWEDGFRLSPAPKSLLTLFGADHALGGIEAHRGMPHSPFDLPAAVALVQALTTAYLRTQLGIDTSAWAKAVADLAGAAQPAGRLVSR